MRAAAQRISSHVRRTPVIAVDGADFGVPGVRLVFKLEFLQHAGSFKTRGAFNNLLTREIPPVGVVAASGGNHGAAVAYAAMKMKRPATIFVPSVASAAKMEQIRGYGARLKVAGERYNDALIASENWIAQSGAAAIHAYDQVETLQGQATVGLEYEEQAPELAALLVAVGGGGLIGAPKRVGSLMFPIAQRHVARTVLVADDAIRAAQRALWKTLRIVAEPGGAAALSALTSGAWKPRAGQTVGVLLCGANTTAVEFK